jgi:excisionase family DNA binding protein
MHDQSNADEHPLDPETPPPPMLLTIQQAADLLQVGRCTMQDLVMTGDIQSFKIGRLRRIPARALDDFVSSHLEVKEDAA